MDVDFSSFKGRQRICERATHPIERIFGRPAWLLLLAWNDHAASSRLMKQLATRLGYQGTIAKSLVIADQPKMRTLECVQLPFPG